ncbi:MAG: DUF1272 domain-containing protein [Aliidongia sp.]
MSLPAGLSADGLPIGAQLVGRMVDEAVLLGLAAQLGAELPRIGPKHIPAGRNRLKLPWRFAMLELRPNCECCGKDLPPDSTDAMICSFECTFCAECNAATLRGICPNCGGNLVARPIRPAALLTKYPASISRKVKARRPASPPRPRHDWRSRPISR